MAGYVRRGAETWFEGWDGSWMRWDAASGRWEPGTPPPPAPGEAPDSSWPNYRTIAPLWRVVAGFLLGIAGLSVIAVLSDLAQLDLLARIRDGVFVSVEEADANDLRQGIIGITQAVVAITTGVLFIIWLHRAYSNVRTLGAENLRFRRGWAIWSWITPIWGLFRPKQLVNDVWRGSDADPPRERSEWSRSPVPGWWGVWWAAFIVSNVVVQVAVRVALGGETLSEFMLATRLYVITDSIDVVGAALGALVVWTTSERQLARAESLGIPPAGRPTVSPVGD